MVIFGDLKDKTVIVTGGAQGIGKGIAKAFVEQNVNIVIADLNEERGRELSAFLGNRAVFQRADLTLESDIRDLVSFTAERFDGLDFVINNARPHILQSLPEMAIEDSLMDGWDIGFDVLLKAPCLLIKHALPLLRKAMAPAIVNIASTNARFISSQPLVYHVAKAALVQMTRFTAKALGGSGVRVNCVAPGIVDILDYNRPLSGVTINKKTAEIAVPLKRAALVEEIASSVLFLCSNASSYINGQMLVVDGGISLGDQFHVTRAALSAKELV